MYGPAPTSILYLVHGDNPSIVDIKISEDKLEVKYLETYARVKHIYELLPVKVINANYFCGALLGLSDLTHLDNVASNTLQVFMTPSEL